MGGARGGGAGQEQPEEEGRRGGGASRGLKGGGGEPGRGRREGSAAARPARENFGSGGKDFLPSGHLRWQTSGDRLVRCCSPPATRPGKRQGIPRAGERGCPASSRLASEGFLDEREARPAAAQSIQIPWSAAAEAGPGD